MRVVLDAVLAAQIGYSAFRRGARSGHGAQANGGVEAATSYFRAVCASRIPLRRVRALESSLRNSNKIEEKANLAATIDSGSPTTRRSRAGRLRGDSTGIPARAGPSGAH